MKCRIYQDQKKNRLTTEEQKRVNAIIGEAIYEKMVKPIVEHQVAAEIAHDEEEYEQILKELNEARKEKKECDTCTHDTDGDFADPACATCKNHELWEKRESK